MTNPTGTRFAEDVCRYFVNTGHPYAERRAQHGANDKGDIAGIIGWVFEVKAERQLDPTTALKEAEAERVNAAAENAAAILKRRGRPVGEALVAMTLEQFARLIRDDDPVTVTRAEWDLLLTLARQALDGGTWPDLGERVPA